MTDVVAMTVAAWSRALIRRCRTALLTATMMTAVASLSGCSIPAGSIPANAGVSEPIAMPGMAVVLRFGDDTAAASLTDTPPGRQLASMLPLTLQLQDVWGQAKSGRLPQTLSTESANPIHSPAAGGIYFWPRSEVIAIYYDDLGQTVPDPGLVHLGVIRTGLNSLVQAGKRFTVRIEPAAPTSS